MPLPTTRADLLDRLREAHRKLDADLEGIDPRSARAPELDDGESVCDVIAYLIGWGELLLGWDASEAAGKTPAMPAEGFGWHELGALKRSLHARRRRHGIPRLRGELRDVVARLDAWVGAFREDDLFALGRRAWAGEKWPVVKWVQVNTVAPLSSARTRIRRFKKARGAS